MPAITYKRKKKQNICIGDLRDEITIQSRTISEPVSGVDFGETFTGKSTVWALVETVSGKTIFDGSNIERDVTHNIYIRYLSGITAEDWVLFKGSRMDILEVQDFDERNEFIILRCSDKGTDVNAANEL